MSTPHDKGVIVGGIHNTLDSDAPEPRYGDTIIQKCTFSLVATLIHNLELGSNDNKPHYMIHCLGKDFHPGYL